MERKQCRLWWPKNILSCKPSSDLLLFGWCFHALDSLDIVVAVATSPNEILLRLSQSDLQEILHSINSKMPMPLQESSTFSILGQCTVDFGDMETISDQNSDPFLRSTQNDGVEENAVPKATECDSVNKQSKKSCLEAPSVENCRSWNCGCEKLNQSIGTLREVLLSCDNWIQLISTSQENMYKGCRWIPKFHHMHQNGHILSISDIHLIVYEPPTYGRHHFCLNPWGYSEQAVIPFKKPNWVCDLYEKYLPPKLEAVVSALNCASAAAVYCKGHLGTISPVTHFYFISRLVSMLWYILAVSVASLSTGTYVVLQFFHKFVNFGSHTFFLAMLRKIFTQTWNNVHIRSCQFLYWPIFLQGGGSRSQSNVEYAHMAALRKHFVWSSIAMDAILGIVFGVAVLANAEAVCFWILFVARYTTDAVLRSGCVWLMGVPAGFKLNIELAELLGMVSLNAIQIFSTLWFLMGSLVWYTVKGLALSGIFFGLTVPAALCIDMLKLATLHVRILHWLMSFLYSQQIQALASLWRLFRGRKWNPLRQRLDSYDYSVEQHVVGSLLFTPLLLLLPTTSVFYIFFTILNTTVSLMGILIEITISVLHGTPYLESLLWMLRRRRFPSGIWFEIISCSNIFISNHSGSDQRKMDDFIRKGPETVVSLLHSNYATIGKIIAPHYRNLFQRDNPFVGMPSAYGILSGQRIPSTLQVNPPKTLPWMEVGCMEYWRLCHGSVLACRSSP